MAQADAGHSGIEQNDFHSSTVVGDFSCGDGVEEALVALLWGRTGELLSARHHFTATRTQVARMRRFGQLFGAGNACV